jgi:hypothetical protein
MSVWLELKRLPQATIDDYSDPPKLLKQGLDSARCEIRPGRQSCRNTTMKVTRRYNKGEGVYCKGSSTGRDLRYKLRGLDKLLVTAYTTRRECRVISRIHVKAIVLQAFLDIGIGIVTGH